MVADKATKRHRPNEVYKFRRYVRYACDKLLTELRFCYIKPCLRWSRLQPDVTCHVNRCHFASTCLPMRSLLRATAMHSSTTSANRQLVERATARMLLWFLQQCLWLDEWLKIRRLKFTPSGNQHDCRNNSSVSGLAWIIHASLRLRTGNVHNC